MTKRRAIKIVLFFVIGAFVLSAARRLFVPPNFSSHQGDGQFKDISRRVGIFVNEGYSISMPEFDLSKPHQAEYKVAALPRIGERIYRIYLVIPDENQTLDNERIGCESMISVQLSDSLKNTLFTVGGHLQSLDRSTRMDREGAQFFQIANTHGNLNSREKYTFTVSYTPDPKLAGYQGYVYFRVGATK